MDKPNPMFFNIRKNGRILFYLGVRHSYDIKDPQFQFIKQKWDEFISLSKFPLAVVEKKLWEVNDTESGAVSKGGEAEFVGFLAQKDRVQTVCFEPDRKEEINYLVNYFTKDQIEYYYFSRTIDQWHRIAKKPNIEEYLTPFLERDKNVSGWKDFYFSIENLKKIHKKLFNTELDFNDKNHFEKIADPTRRDNPLREIASYSGNHRDKIIIEKIKEAWKDKDLFIVYGKDHVIAHKKDLNS